MRMRGRKEVRSIDPREQRARKSAVKKMLGGMFGGSTKADEIEEKVEAGELTPEEATPLLNLVDPGRVRRRRSAQNLPRRNTPKRERRPTQKVVAQPLTAEGRLLFIRTFNHDVRPRKSGKGRRLVRK